MVFIKLQNAPKREEKREQARQGGHADPSTRGQLSVWVEPTNEPSMTALCMFVCLCICVLMLTFQFQQILLLLLLLLSLGFIKMTFLK